MSQRGMMACIGVYVLAAVLGWCVVAVITAVWWVA